MGNTIIIAADTLCFGLALKMKKVFGYAVKLILICGIFGLDDQVVRNSILKNRYKNT